MKILIVGHGFVGKAVDYGFSTTNVEKTIIDPKYDTRIEDVDVWSYNFVFVCVPTPMSANGSVDSSIIDNVLNALYKDAPENYQRIVIIKSTIPPNVVENYNHPSIVYNPEFLTEKSANEQFIDPQFHVIGGHPQATQNVAMLYNNFSLCNPTKIHLVGIKEASMIKYAINTFLATKVTFFNQLYDVAKENGIDFTSVIKVVGEDERIGHSHTKVPGFDGKQGFGGACFPKDCSAFVSYNNKLTLLDKVIKINNSYRTKYTLDEREIEQNVNYGEAEKEQQSESNRGTE